MLADALERSSFAGSVRTGLLAALRELEESGVLAAALWSAYRKIDEAPDFPLIKLGWGPLKWTLTKEKSERILRWFLTWLVGPEPT